MIRDVRALLGAAFFLVVVARSSGAQVGVPGTPDSAALERLRQTWRAPDSIPATKVQYLCTAVGTKEETETKKPLYYEYERALWEMSGATPGVDTRDVARIKIQKMWERHRTSLVCNTAGFAPANVVKLGVQNTFLKFIKDVVNRYQLDINFIDPKDGKTVLDYTREQRDAAHRLNKDPGFMKELDDIYSYLLERGAKRADELRERGKGRQ